MISSMNVEENYQSNDLTHGQQIWYNEAVPRVPKPTLILTRINQTQLMVGGHETLQVREVLYTWNQKCSRE